MNERLAIEWRDLRYLNEISFAMLKQTKFTVLKVLWVCNRIKGVKSANKGSQAQELCHSLVFAHVKLVIEILHLNLFLSFISEWALAFISLIGVWFG